MLAPENAVSSLLERIENTDLLIIFSYLNLAITHFTCKNTGKSLEKINPNLFRLFMRHYPTFANERKYELFSEDEDYEEVEGR